MSAITLNIQGPDLEIRYNRGDLDSSFTVNGLLFMSTRYMLFFVHIAPVESRCG